MPSSLLETIQDMVLDNPKPAKVICEEVGKPYPTLLRELNPEDHAAKVGVELLVPLMRSCGSVAPLEYLAALMGYRLVPAAVTPDRDDLRDECLDDMEAVTELARAARDGGTTHQEMVEMVSRAHRELDETYALWRRDRDGATGRPCKIGQVRSGGAWKTVAMEDAAQ